MKIRRAINDEAPELTQLARASKASWGYPREWLQEWEQELRISEDYIRANAVFVAESGGSLIGVIGIEDGQHGPEISHLWVSPASQGTGIGRALVDRAKTIARERHWEFLRVVSDPGAQSFYERMGAIQIGELAAPVAGNARMLPVLRLGV